MRYHKKAQPLPWYGGKRRRQHVRRAILTRRLTINQDRIVHLMHPNGARTICGKDLFSRASRPVILVLTLARRTTCLRCQETKLWGRLARRPIETDITEHGERQ